MALFGFLSNGEKPQNAQRVRLSALSWFGSIAASWIYSQLFILSLIFFQNIALSFSGWQPHESALSFEAEGRNASTDMIATEKSLSLVFLAEDSEDDAFFFDRALRKADVGCSLLRAPNGKIAIEMLTRATTAAGLWPILIFLDLKMPVMSGFEVLLWLQFAGLDPAPKVIVLSGSNDQDDRARAQSLGAADYLVKPITAEILREMILRQLDLRRAGQTGTRIETRASV